LPSAVALPKSLQGSKSNNLPKPGKDPKFPQHLRPISLLPTTGKLFEKVILKFVQKHIEEKGLLNASQFGFRARHSTTLQCMRLTDHVTLNFNNKMSTAAVFLDIEKAFDTTWHPSLLYKLSKLEFSTNLIKLFGSFLSQKKKIQGFGRRRDVNAKGDASRGATGFGPVPYTFYHVHK
jgi:hypothetical protein